MPLLLIVAAFLFLLGIAPLIVLWCLNTLFPALAIPYNFYTWLAAMLLLVRVTPIPRKSE